MNVKVGLLLAGMIGLLLSGCGESPEAGIRPLQLRDAAALGDEDLIRLALERSPELVNAADPLKMTALHFAASRGSLPIVDRLLAAHADPNLQDILGFAPLHQAALFSRLDVVQHLLAAGARPSIASNEGWQPLHYAATLHSDPTLNTGRLQVIRLLLDAKASINAPGGQWKVTPLHIATRSGSVEMVKLLLDAGADSACKDSEGRTPLDEATDRKDPALIELLKGRTTQP